MSNDEKKRLRSGSTSVAPKKDGDNVNHAGATLESVLQILTKRFDETNQKIDSLKTDLTSKLNEIQQDLQKQIDSIKSDVIKLETNNSEELQSIRSDLTVVTNRLDSATETIRRAQLRNELIAVGIPYVSNEDLQSHLLNMARAIGFDECKTQHIQCKRLRSGDLSDGVQCFTLLQFSMASLRDEFYAKYLSKRNLNLKHLGFVLDRRIFVNENLTPSARSVKQSALKLRKENKLVTVTTKQGIVHVRKTVNGPLVPITSVAQLG